MSESNSFWIRNLREVDVPALLEIERSCFPDPWPVQWFKEPIRSRDICLGACNGTKIIGYLICCREDNVLHLANLAVDPECRRQGVATALLNQVFQMTRNARFSEVYLEVRRSNIEAIRIYERYGFQITGVEEQYYQGSEDALIMKVKPNGLV